MTIYKRPDNTIFAESAQSGEVVAFENMPRGWGVTLDSTKGIPPMEWFNFLQNRTDKAIQYILQNGITEYDTNLEYPQNAVVKSNGKLYLCLRQNTNKPLSNGAYWELLIKNATTSQKGIVQLSNDINSSDETKASTPKATKTAYDKAVQADNNANTRLKINGSSVMTNSLKLQQTGSDWISVKLTNARKETLAIEKFPEVRNGGSQGWIVTKNENGDNIQYCYLPASNGTLAIHSEVINEINKQFKIANDNANSRVKIDGSSVMTDSLKLQQTGSDWISVKLTDNKKESLTFEKFPYLRSGSHGWFAIKDKDNKNIQEYYLPTKSGVLAIRDDGVPAGAFFPYSAKSLPSGYLWMDNGYYDPKTYPDLFAVLGYYYGRQGDKFLVPSIENRFIRGMGNGLKLGQKQEDAIRNITGQFPGDDAGTARPGGAFYDAGENRGPGGNATGRLFKFDASRVVPTADENRPKSIAFPYIIKY